MSGGGVHYFNVTSNLNTGAAVLTGSANDIIVVNVTSNAQLAFTGSITLAGGLTADNVLFNFTGTSKFQGNNNGGTSAVDVIVNTTNGVNVDNSNFNGRIFDIATTGSFQLVSGLNINSPGPILASAPEVSSELMLLSGMGLLALATLRKKSIKK